MRDSDLPIRAGILRGLPALVAELGGDGDALLAAYGIDAGLVTQHDAFVSLRRVERLLEDAASRLGVPDLGLRMAAQQDLHILGPLAIAMENAQTVGDALQSAERFLFILSPALSHEVIADPLGNQSLLALRYTSSTGTVSPQSIDLPHGRIAPEAVYREHFGAEVTFDSPETLLRIPRQLLAVPVADGNELLRDIAVDFLETHFGHDEVPLADLVLAILEGQPGPDRPDLAKVARLLSMHPRSLQRLLVAEGAGFKDLVDRVRRDEAHKLITATNLSFSQIAIQVGLREQSSLTRAVRRWFGTSPSDLRRDAARTS